MRFMVQGRWSRSFLFVGLVVATAAGCSEDDDDSDSDDGSDTITLPGAGSGPGGRPNGTAGTGVGTAGRASFGGGPNANGGRTGGGGTGNTGNTGTGNTGNVAQCSGLSFVDDGGEQCVGIEFEAEPVPADLFIMMDRSISQSRVIPGTTTIRWDALRNAVAAFAEEAADSDIRVGIGFFGRTGGRDDNLDCDVNYYAEPKVEIGPLADIGDDLVAAIEEQIPSGLTPTRPALEGAHQYAAAYAAANPARAVSVVLVTDGYPTQCTDVVSVSDLAAIAEEARATAPYIRTFVIGLAAEGNLNTIARYGGTNQAYLVDEGDTTASFTNALRNITNSPVPCRFEIPEPPSGGEVIDPNKVQVAYLPASGTPEEVPRLGSADACNDQRAVNGGWYFDNSSDPRNILVCPCTCSRFGAGQVDIRIGCEPQVGIR
jgi:hypothetical protein